MVVGIHSAVKISPLNAGSINFYRGNHNHIRIFCKIYVYVLDVNDGGYF
jgi:hypothetical protein